MRWRDIKDGTRTNVIKVARERDEAVAQACARLRQRVFMQTYGPLGLQSWPGEPDRFDREAALFTARQDSTLVGTALLHHEDYDGQPFWHDRFGLTVGDLVPEPCGRRIGEIGRVAVDKSAAANPLEVATALATRLGRVIAEAGIGPVIAVALSAPMLAFYEDLVRRAGGRIEVHPRTMPYAGVEVRYMVLHIDDADYV